MKNPASTYLSVSMSLDTGLLIQILQFAQEQDFSRSEALRYLVEAGLNYEGSIVPERRREAEERQNLAKMLAGLEAKLPKLADSESYYYNNNQPENIDERTPPAEARTV